MTAVKESFRINQLKARLIVGILGERSHFAWWPTAFFDASSRPFLEPVFSKTSRLAQYHGVLEAARRLHDEHLSVGSYHLFRLPEEVEQDLHEIARSGVGEELAAQMPQERAAALEVLRPLAGIGIGAVEGPTLIGSINALDSAETMSGILGGYFAAFSRNTRIYPYLAS